MFPDQGPSWVPSQPRLPCAQRAQVSPSMPRASRVLLEAACGTLADSVAWSWQPGSELHGTSSACRLSTLAASCERGSRGAGLVAAAGPRRLPGRGSRPGTFPLWESGSGSWLSVRGVGGEWGRQETTQFPQRVLRPQLIPTCRASWYFMQWCLQSD